MFQGTLVKTWVAQQLHLAKTGPASIGLLGSGTYTITITNFGTAPATGLDAGGHRAPPACMYVSANPAPTSAPDPETAGGTITWNLEDLAANDGSTEITVELRGVQIGTHRQQRNGHFRPIPRPTTPATRWWSPAPSWSIRIATNQKLINEKIRPAR